MIIIVLVVIAAAIFLPQWWVKRVLRRYQEPGDRYQGTGGQLARHLLDRLGLESVGVERTEPGADHYDPEDRMVRLSPAHYDKSSLAAITVAAHEVGHAIQHADGYPPLRWRTQLVLFSRSAQRLGAILLLAAPLIMVATRLPTAGFLFLVGGLLTMGTAVIVHLVTLPTEVDASFRRALPLLEAGYLRPEDKAPARRILTAAACTYLAAALGSLLNVWVWLRLLRP